MSFSNHDALAVTMPVKESVDALSFRKLGLVSRDAPEFDFIAFFSGHTRANGWFSDRFGKPRRHFCGDFHGVLSGDKLELHEELRFTNGISEQRIWNAAVSQTGEFTAESDSLIGNATGGVQGSTLVMEYRMRVLIEKEMYWELDMRDTMILQSDGSLHNITLVYKWGVRIGSVSTIYLKHSG
jgi:hypothetical protein